MAELKVKVKMDTSPAIKSLDNLNRKINAMNKTVTSTATTMTRVDNANRKAANSAKQMASGYKTANSAANHLYRSVARVVGLLIGAKGLGTLVTTADVMTGAKNKLNAINASQLGDSGVGGYSEATLKATEETMNKIFASSQKVRTGYTDMMTNVAKSMSLAGDAFDGNIDNAIRFQEIMAEAYAVAGASQAEMSSSMYQMVQGLGSGILQGDELRSIREGAPLAYRAIEEFAQGVYGAEESLKDLASQGKITSDIVVAAILSAGDQLDASFANTTTTFAQTWQMIKNVATQAFTPVMTAMTNLLNSETGAKILNGVVYVIQAAANALLWFVNIVSMVLTFIVDNWSWVQYIVYFGLGILIAMLAAMAMQAVKTFFLFAWQALQAAAPVLLIAAVIGIVIYMIVRLANTTASGAEFIQQVCLMLAYTLMAIALMVALVTGNTTLALVIGIIALIVGLVAIISAYGEEIGRIVGYVVAFCYNLVVGLINGVIQLVWSLIEPIIGIMEYILNCCMGGFTSFEGAVANLIGNIISWFLSLGKVVTTIIDAIFGSDWTGALTNLQNSVLAWGKKDTAISLSREAPLIQYMDYATAGDVGASIGNSWSGAINNFGDKLQSGITGLGSLPSLGGADFGSFSADSGSLNWAAPDVGGLTTTPGLSGGGLDELLGTGGNTGGIGGSLNDIAGDTSRIADSMELTEEDVELLRKIANSEFKKEFWVTGINVDMSNYNTIGGNSDLDGIVTQLTDKLYEELNAVSNGVYA